MKSKLKATSGINPTAIANRKYKEKIYAMCRRVERGDETAEKMLNKELESNTIAQWAVKHWMKLRASRLKKVGMGPNKDGLPVSRAKGRKQPKRGNAFKPYQGGIPGLGKKA